MFVQGKSRRWLIIAGAILAVSLLVITPALAADIYDDDVVVIDEDVADDVYAVGETITVNATIDGDLIAAGRTLVLNGTVTGDVLFGGQTMILKGEVQDDVRFGGMALVVEDGAIIGDDLNFGGYALEMKTGSAVGGDALVAGYQALVADVGGSMYAAAGNVRFEGSVSGDADLAVSSGDDSPFSPMSFMPQEDVPPLSDLPGGLTFGEDAAIGGHLSYTADEEMSIPSGVVGGLVEFTQEVPEVEAEARTRSRGFTVSANPMLRYSGFVVSGSLVLVLAGWLLRRLAPAFLDNTLTTLRGRVLASLGAGFVGYAAVYVVLPALLFLTVVLVILPLSGAGERLVGALSLTIASTWLVFRLATQWIAPLLVAILLGGWLYGLIDREKKSAIGSLIVGVVALMLLMGVPFLGRFVLAFLVGMTGLGAVILTLWPPKQTEAAPVAQGEPAV